MQGKDLALTEARSTRRRQLPENSKTDALTHQTSPDSSVPWGLSESPALKQFSVEAVMVVEARAVEPRLCETA